MWHPRNRKQVELFLTWNENKYEITKRQETIKINPFLQHSRFQTLATFTNKIDICYYIQFRLPHSLDLQTLKYNLMFTGPCIIVITEE